MQRAWARECVLNGGACKGAILKILKESEKVSIVPIRYAALPGSRHKGASICYPATDRTVGGPRDGRIKKTVGGSWG